MLSNMKSSGHWFVSFITSSMYIFLYMPIVILVAISFNESQYARQWTGFSLKWYYELFESVEVLDAIYNSLVVAFFAVLLSVVMGVMLVLYASRTSLQRSFGLFYATLATPEIIIAVCLLTVFMFVSVPLGLLTVIIGHTLLGLGYVVPIVYDRFTEIDYRLTEASMDLGATQAQTIRKVVLPLLSPAIVASALLVFTISLDDFVIAFFCSGSSAQTLPIFIFSMIRSGEYTLVNAISVVLLAVTVVLVLLFSSLNVNKAEMMS